MQYGISILLSGISLGGQYALIAIGYTMVYGILRLINFAHGDVFMAAGLIMVYLSASLPIGVALPLMILLTVLLGFVIERAAYKPLRSAPRMSVMISAIGVSYLLQNLATYITGGLPQMYPSLPGLSSQITIAGTSTKMVTVITPFLVVAVCIGIMVLLINSTYGRAFKAIREDEVAAEAMGINLAKHKRMAFCISSFFAGVGGGLFAMFANQAQAKTFTTSMTYEILLIVVIGGIGSISGSCIASFLYVAASEWWLRFLDTETYIGAFKVPFLRTGFRMVVFSIIIMIVVLFFRRGLMGDRELSDVARSLRARLSGRSKKKEAAK